jgi:hypothetical protein
MDAPPVAQPDLRPSRAQIEALLAGLAMTSAIRPAVLDAFEEQGLLAFTSLIRRSRWMTWGAFVKLASMKRSNASMKLSEMRLSLS